LSSSAPGARRVVAVAVVAVLLSGCELLGLGGPKGGTYPAACAGLGFSARRCAAIVDRAQKDAELNASSIVGIEILPPPRDDSARLGGTMVAQVRFTLTDGPSSTKDVWCKGVGSFDDLACQVDPEIQLSGGIDHDVPCAGEAPNGDPAGCATLPPTPPPAAVAAAKPLRLAVLDIPLGHLGRYEIKVGHAGLPNGYLSARQFGIADPRPKDFWIRGGILLDVRPGPGRPPVGSIYRDPFKGTEPVDVFLVFEVTETSPGAVLHVRDVVVE
jgi:hypothetical protein